MDARWLIEWMRIGEEWHCQGPLPEHCGFVIIGSGKFRTPAAIVCNRTEPDKEPYVRAHMMGASKGVLDSYGDLDNSFWERWYLPPGVHPLDVLETVKSENKLFEDDIELEGQVMGYWFGPEEEIPEEPPERTTGAVLPPLNESLDGTGRLCLDLVKAGGQWRPVSDLGAYSYRHGAGLGHEEPWRFVPAHDWPTIYEVSLEAPLERSAVEETYGAEAANRTREDAPTTCLRLTRVLDLMDFLMSRTMRPF